MSNDGQFKKGRVATGRPFAPGQSGNPGGRKKGLDRLVRDLVGDDLPKLIKAQIRIAQGLPPEEALAVEVKAADVTRACEWLATRGWGPTKQTIEIADGEATTSLDWSKVPLELRRQLLAYLFEGSDAPATEH